MFDEYSNMIKKLLEDKEKLTSQLEKSRQRLFDEEESKRTMQREYENKIRIIVEENNAQVSCTKQQIE
jgi:DNA anti-recombination protein RmuC